VSICTGHPAETDEPQSKPRASPEQGLCAAPIRRYSPESFALGGELSAGRRGVCGLSTVTAVQFRGAGVGAPAGEGLWGEGRRDTRCWRGRGHQVAGPRTATAALLEGGLSVNVRALRRMRVRAVSCGISLCEDAWQPAEEVSRRADVGQVCSAEQGERRLGEVAKFSLMLNTWWQVTP
jgi:hypothetical protein